MKHHILKIFLISVFSLLLTAAGCKSSPGVITSEDELTPGEKKLLVENARQILLLSGKVKDENKAGRKPRKVNDKKESTRRLSDYEKHIIRTTIPEIRIMYTGHKEGKASMTWTLSNSRRLILKAEGDLLESDKRWSMIVSDYEDVIITPEARRQLEKANSPLLKNLDNIKNINRGKINAVR